MYLNSTEVVIFHFQWSKRQVGSKPTRVHRYHTRSDLILMRTNPNSAAVVVIHLRWKKTTLGSRPTRVHQRHCHKNLSQMRLQSLMQSQSAQEHKLISKTRIWTERRTTLLIIFAHFSSHTQFSVTTYIIFVYLVWSESKLTVYRFILQVSAGWCGRYIMCY